MSADVTHSFAIPDLDLGPVTVEPGHVSEVRFTPQEPGEFLTQCATRCGECHEEMLGTIVVLGPGQTLADYDEAVLPPRTKCHLEGGE
jgi:heme/copper-type cytochrome/quinol oxidase subunit 2